MSPALPSTQQDYFGEHAAVVSSQGERRSRRKSRSKIRAYLYGSNNEAIPTPSDNEDGQNAFVGAARDVKKRLSRSGSSIMQLQSAKTSTAHLSDCSSSRLQLTGSQSSDAEESAILADQIKERAYQDRVAAQNYVTPPVDEDKHVDSVMAPVRRKSLYTPGLATRNPSDILRKPARPATMEPQSDRDYYYDPSKPQESPLSQLAALHLGEDGRSTPSNMNYPQLGGLQLGTLRVTNGTASPIPQNRAPEFVGPSLTPDSKNHDEYYSAFEGSAIGERSVACTPSRSNFLGFGNEHESSFPLNNLNNLAPLGCGLPKDSGGAASMAHEYISELAGSPFSCFNTTSFRDTDILGEDEAMVIPKTEDPASDAWTTLIPNAGIRRNDSATQEDALRKLNGDPSSLSEHDHLQRLSTLCSLSSQYSGPAEVPNSDSGYGSNASLGVDQTGAQGDGTAARFPVMSQEMHPTTEQSNPVGSTSYEVPQKSSPRSISRPGEMPIPERGRYSLQASGPPPLPYLSSVMPRPETLRTRRSATSSSSMIARKLQKPRPKSQPPSPKIIVQNCRELSEAQIPRVPSIIAARHAERIRQFPLLDHTFPSSNHVSIDDCVSLTGTSAEVFSVPIRFPSPANALEAAAKGDSLKSSSPRVPDKRQKSRSRASSKQWNSGAAETQEDEWSASGIVRSPSWSDFARGRKTKEQRKLAKQERENVKRLAKEEKELEKRLEKSHKDFERQTKKEDKRKSSRSRSASRGRSSERLYQCETMASIADFGTVAESLGGNPYDIATSMLPSLTSNRRSSSRHPHQISTSTLGPQSLVGVGDGAAAEAARTRSRARSRSLGRPSPQAEEKSEFCDSNRSRTRPQTMFVDIPPMPALAAVDLKARHLDWANDRQTSRTITGNRALGVGSLNDDALPGRSTIVQSTYVDAPPVPPPAQQFEQPEVQIVKTQPRSIADDAHESPRSRPITQGARENESTLPVSERSRPAKLTKPRRTDTVRVFPNLWTSGSLERKIPKLESKPAAFETAVDKSSSGEDHVVQSDNVWEAQAKAWRQRRKSAGEALLRNQITEIFENRPTTLNSSPLQKPEDRPPAPVRAVTASPGNPVREEKSGPTPLPSFPNPLASHPYVAQHQPFEAAPAKSPFTTQPPETNNLPITHPQALHPGPSSLPPQPISYQPQYQPPPFLRSSYAK